MDTNVEGKDKDTLNTLLLLAAASNEPDVCRFLLKHGADANAKDKVYWTRPLHFAATFGNKPMCELLIEHGADVNVHALTGPCTPLHAAAENGRLGICFYLMEHGANKYTKNGSGFTPGAELELWSEGYGIPLETEVDVKKLQVTLALLNTDRTPATTAKVEDVPMSFKCPRCGCTELHVVQRHTDTVREAGSIVRTACGLVITPQEGEPLEASEMDGETYRCAECGCEEVSKGCYRKEGTY